jgi:hypothetical protein
VLKFHSTQSGEELEHSISLGAAIFSCETNDQVISHDALIAEVELFSASLK